MSLTKLNSCTTASPGNNIMFYILDTLCFLPLSLAFFYLIRCLCLFFFFSQLFISLNSVSPLFIFSHTLFTGVYFSPLLFPTSLPLLESLNGNFSHFPPVPASGIHCHGRGANSPGFYSFLNFFFLLLYIDTDKSDEFI